MLNQNSAIFRFIAFITLMTFFPSAIAVWNLVPERWVIAEATSRNETISSDKNIENSALPTKQALRERKIHSLPAARAILNAISEIDKESKIAPNAQVSSVAGVDQTLAVSQTTQLRGPLGPPEAADRQAEAEILENSGMYSEAFIEYLQIIDDFPITNEAQSADQGIWNILEGLERGDIQLIQLASGEEFLETWEPRTVEGAYTALTYASERALAERRAENHERMGHYALTAMRVVNNILNMDSGHYLIQSILDYYYEIAELLGEEWLLEFETRLQEFAKTHYGTLGAFGAHYELALHYQGKKRDMGRATNHFWAAADELSRGTLAPVIMDESIPYWVKGELGLAAGTSCLMIGEPNIALEVLTAIDPLCWREATVRWRLTFQIAEIKSQLATNPNEAAASWLDYIADHPDSHLISSALLRLAKVYIYAGDYDGAGDIYSEIIATYPDTAERRVAESGLEYLMEHLFGTVEVFDAPVSDTSQIAQDCGPQALQQLIALRGKDVVSLEALSELSGAGTFGTSILGLSHAAAQNGIRLTGVKATHPAELQTPFIALVDNNHYILVTELSQASVSIIESANQSRQVPLQDFLSRWDGDALVENVGTAQELRLSAMVALIGGRNGEPPQTPDYPAPRTCDYCPCPGGGAISGPGTPPSAPGPESGVPGTPSSPTAATGAWSPGVHPIVNTFNTGLYLDERDVALRTRGTTAVTFERIYSNTYGYHRGHFQDATKPYSNIIGDGWTHSLNMHLITDGLPNPNTVTFYDVDGEARVYPYLGTYLGTRFYKRSSTGQTAERANWISQNTTTLKFSMMIGRQLAYQFSESDGSGFVRLDAINDLSGNTTTLEYDGAVGAGKLTKVKSPAGDPQHLKLTYTGNLITEVQLKQSGTILQAVQYAYNEFDELTKVTDNDTKTVQYEMVQPGGVTGARAISKVTDKMGRQTTFGWTMTEDANSDFYATKIEVTAPDGLVSVFDRDINSSICTITNKNGATALTKVQNLPRASGIDSSRSSEKRYYFGNLTSYNSWVYEYNASSDLTKVKRPGGITFATYTYNADGRISTIAGNDGVAVTYYYDTGAFPTKIRDKAGLDTTFQYVVVSNLQTTLTKVITPWSGAAGFAREYSTSGLMTKAVDPNGNNWLFGYSTVGDVTSAKDPLNNETKYEWDALGNMTKVTDPRNKVTTFEFATSGCGGCGGSGGRMTKVKDALNNATTFAYDANENLTRVTDAKSVVTDFFYDTMNRATKVESPSGSGTVATFAFNKLGQMTRATDFKGTNGDLYYDFMGRITKSADPLRNVQSLYTDAGVLSTITDGAGNLSEYLYDATLRLTKVNYPGTAKAKYFYDTPGRLTKVGAGSSGTTDPTEYTFNGVTGLLTKTRFTSGATTSDVVFGYDSTARVTKLTDWIDNVDGIRYAYDLAGRLTKITDYDDTTYDYTYDAAGNVVTTDDYAGAVSTYSYTDRSELSTITAPGTKVWDFDYNPLGQPTKVAHPNSVTSDYVYDNRNRVITIQHNDGGSVLDRFDLKLDKQGVLTKLVHSDGSFWNYDYDSADRLTRARRRDAASTLLWTYAYTYTLNDDVTTKEVTDHGPSTTTTTTFSYNNARELITKTVGATNTAFTYDDWGQLISKIQGASLATYHYNYGGLMTKASSNFSGEGTVEYEYGGDGKRRERVAGASYTWYNYGAGFGIASEEDNAGALNKTWIGGLAEIASSNPATGAYTYYLLDQQGSTRRRLNQSRVTQTTYEYTPYGELYSSTGTNVSRRYVGMDNESKTELLFTPFRMYNPEVGRFISRDPIFTSPNAYAYSFVDPLNFVDSVGDNPLLVTAGVGALIGGGVGAGYEWWNNPSATWGDIAYGGLRGALVGGVGGLTLGLGGSAIAGTLGGGIAGGVLSGASAGAAGELAGQILDISVGESCDISLGDIGLAAAGGAILGAPFLRPFTRQNQGVSSWAPNGISPDLNPGRWAMVGGPSLRNYIGTIGPAIRPGGRYPFSNAAFDFRPSTQLSYPPGATGNLAGLIGQRIILP